MRLIYSGSDHKQPYIIAAIMLAAAAIFILTALKNPQAGFPWSNTVTYIFYGLYLIVMIVLFIASFKKNR